MARARAIVGERTPLEIRHRNTVQDRRDALRLHANDHEALMYLHGLGYDVSDARVLHGPAYTSTDFDPVDGFPYPKA